MVLWWVDVDGCLVVNVKIGVLWFCDVPVSYAKAIDNGDGSICSSAQVCCNGHYNRTPDLGKCMMWWNVWDLAR